MNSDKFRELERSFDSDPFNIYVEEGKENNYKGSGSGGTSRSDDLKSHRSDPRRIVTSSSDMTVSRSSSHSSSDVIHDFMDSDLELMREIIQTEADANRENPSVMMSTTHTSADWNSFFNCFDIEKSINNVIACDDKETITYKSVADQQIPDVSSNYIFEKDPHILPDQGSDPFIEYDQIGYEDDKNRHKQQKNINRLGMIALSTAVVMGSAWIHNIFHN